jgi:hypothetical protein
VPLSALTLDAPRFTTDEAIVGLIDKDFGRIVPESQKWASGNDGTITQGLPWVLVSSQVDFARNGVTPGRIVKLTAPVGTPPNKAYGDVELAVVVRADGPSLTLRRPNRVPYAGHPYFQPIVDNNNLPVSQFAGITFLVSSLDSFIEDATNQVRDNLLDLAAGAGISTAALADLLSDERLVKLTTWLAVEQGFLNVGKVFTATGSGPDEMAGKAGAYRKKYERDWAEIEERVRPRSWSVSSGAIQLGGSGSRSEWE